MACHDSKYNLPGFAGPYPDANGGPRRDQSEGDGLQGCYPSAVVPHPMTATRRLASKLILDPDVANLALDTRPVVTDEGRTGYMVELSYFVEAEADDDGDIQVAVTGVRLDLFGNEHWLDLDVNGESDAMLVGRKVAEAFHSLLRRADDDAVTG
jgi:hypothetical protein